MVKYKLSDIFRVKSVILFLAILVSSIDGWAEAQESTFDGLDFYEHAMVSGIGFQGNAGMTGENLGAQSLRLVPQVSLGVHNINATFSTTRTKTEYKAPADLNLPSIDFAGPEATFSNGELYWRLLPELQIHVQGNKFSERLPAGDLSDITNNLQSGSVKLSFLSQQGQIKFDPTLATWAYYVNPLIRTSWLDPMHRNTNDSAQPIELLNYKQSRLLFRANHYQSALDKYLFLEDDNQMNMFLFDEKREGRGTQFMADYQLRPWKNIVGRLSLAFSRHQDLYDLSDEYVDIDPMESTFQQSSSSFLLDYFSQQFYHQLKLGYSHFSHNASVLPGWYPDAFLSSNGRDPVKVKFHRYTGGYGIHFMKNIKPVDAGTYLANWNQNLIAQLPANGLLIRGNIQLNQYGNVSSTLPLKIKHFLPEAETYASLHTLLDIRFSPMTDLLELGYSFEYSGIWERKQSHEFNKGKIWAVPETNKENYFSYFGLEPVDNVHQVSFKFCNYRYSDRFEQYNWYRLTDFDRQYGPLLGSGMASIELIYKNLPGLNASRIPFSLDFEYRRKNTNVLGFRSRMGGFGFDGLEIELSGMIEPSELSDYSDADNYIANALLKWQATKYLRIQAGRESHSVLDENFWAFHEHYYTIHVMGLF